MNQKLIKDSALKTIKIENEAINALEKSINESFISSVQLIFESKGRLIISGIGKSAIIAQKIVATLNSTGTAALFMHAAEGIHGDLGMIQKDDIVMLISKSGESPEIKVLIPLIKNFGNKIIALCGNEHSVLAKQADYFLDTTVKQEACPNNLAPTSSTTAQLVLGDAIAVALLNLKGFTANDFAKFHPGGTLGKQLYLRVKSIAEENQKPIVFEDDSIKKVIMEITSKRLGITVVLNENNKIIGVITDGDIRRMLEKYNDLSDIKAKNIMSPNPKTIEENTLAVYALEMLRKNNISQLVVVNKDEYKGIVHIHDLLKEGII
ncbi:MAG: KpsF/GutQ family sugar-phosphate isomerase, partial [Bacteroidia bacterium]|nr:KpsF/GutQ family sugar-phosphate isomerase [Bacteroidia bacterium]